MNVHEKLRDLNVGYLAGKRGFIEERPTLVMLHGAGGSSRVWQNQISFLDKNLNVLALDLPGHGETEGQGHSSISAYAQWLGEILRVLFDYSVFLMGHSMGGAIVQETVSDRPNALEGIILVGTGARMKVAPMFMDALLNNFEHTVDTFIGYAYSLKTDRSIVDEGGRLMKEAGGSVVYNDFTACDQFDSNKGLIHMNLPCLILCGSEDKLTPPELSESLKKGIKGAILKIVPDAGHMVMVERPKELNESVQEFILGTRP
ncbi:MAG: alpha/beta hydrolase [Desulfatiglandales bacterium]